MAGMHGTVLLVLGLLRYDTSRASLWLLLVVVLVSGNECLAHLTPPDPQLAGNRKAKEPLPPCNGATTARAISASNAHCAIFASPRCQKPRSSAFNMGPLPTSQDARIRAGWPTEEESSGRAAYSGDDGCLARLLSPVCLLSRCLSAFCHWQLPSTADCLLRLGRPVPVSAATIER